MSQPFLQPFNPAAWVESQLQRFGPVVGGEDLRQLLGFRTPAAFMKARRLGTVGVTLLQLEGRKGHFALTEEVCRWLIGQHEAAQTAAAGSAGTPMRKVPHEGP